VDNVTRAMKLLVTESKNEGKKSIKYNNKKNLKLSILEIRKNLERRAKNA
jgi:phosphopantothenate synthetase